MKLHEKKIVGAYEIQLDTKEDERGFFMRTYDEQIFKEKDLNTEWVQENHSFSKEKNTVRGLHFQFPPHAETKLVRVATGEVFFAYVDLRKGSDTFGKAETTILSAEKKNALYLPEGFALGMCTLTENCTLLYKMGAPYAPEHQGVILWNDPALKIDWPTEEPILSGRDKNAQLFEEFVKEHGALKFTEGSLDE